MGMRREVPELIPPEEGLSTLSAQITRQSVERILQIIRRERERGLLRERILGALRRELSGYDEHTCQLLLQLAFEEPVQDDFEAANIIAADSSRLGKMILTVRESPGDLSLHSLVRYDGKLWLVVESREKQWTLKAL